MSYTTEHAGALADAATAGAAVTFTRTAIAISETDGSSSQTTSTISGYAFEKMAGESDVYQALGLVRSLAPLLFFVPSIYGDEVQVDDTCTWNGATYTVRSARHLRPSASVVLSYLVVSR